MPSRLSRAGRRPLNLPQNPLPLPGAGMDTCVESQSAAITNPVIAIMQGGVAPAKEAEENERTAESPHTSVGGTDSTPANTLQPAPVPAKDAWAASDRLAL